MSSASLRRTGFGRTDPDSLRERRGPRRFADEAHGVLVEGRSQDALPVVEDPGGKPMARSPSGTPGGGSRFPAAYPLGRAPQSRRQRPEFRL